MDYLQIDGKCALGGDVAISGAKNAALPLIALSILAKNPLTLRNVPNVVDVKTLIKLLEMLGGESAGIALNRAESNKDSADSVESTESARDSALNNATDSRIRADLTRDSATKTLKDSTKSADLTRDSALDSTNATPSGTITLSTESLSKTTVIYDIVRKMRASILLLGPLLARFRECQVSLPGGCAIGARPVDLHIKAMQNLGADIEIKNGYIAAKAPRGLKGGVITFDKITVTGTENVIMLAALARGKTTIINPAKEPEIVQLCEVLREGGLDIRGGGSDEISIYGTDGELLALREANIIPDRIEAGTYLCAGAITNSQITLHRANPKHLEAVISKLREIGFGFEIGEDSITIIPAPTRKAFELTTSEYPGFPTDMQAQFMALATQCEGTSTIKERLFENRFMHASELQRLGANISLLGNVANITQSELIGADVMATDLRASSALILAALIAQGRSKIHRIYHLDRGYERLEAKLSALGAKITRLSE